MNTYGLIVGIDKYDQPQWSMSGPCRNALAIAKWMTTITDPQKIWLFLDTVDELEADVSSLREQKVNVTESARWTDLDDFCFKQLANERPACSRLLMFWSGHAYVANSGQRIFVCRDYNSIGFQNRVFNASIFLRHLRSPVFHCFSEVLMLADVCGTHQDVEIQDPRAGPTRTGQARQLAVFATPEGEYAHGENGEGAFTRATLSALRRIRGWPDLTKFYGKLKVKLRKAGQTPFRVNVEGESGTLDEVFGRVSGSELFESVFWMLNAVAVPPTTYQFHYRRTVNRLGNLELHRAQGLMGMIRELASLQDAHAGHASYGLLDFLVRLTQVKELTEKVDQWLTANASNEASTVQGLREDLRDENLALVLLVELDNDPGGEITAFQPYLRTQNLALVTREHLAIIRGELG